LARVVVEPLRKLGDQVAEGAGQQPWATGRAEPSVGSHHSSNSAIAACSS